MGADLIVNFVWAKKDTPPDWDGLRIHIENMSVSELKDHPEFEYHSWMVDSGNEEPTDLETSASLRNHLLECHDAVRDVWDNPGKCGRNTFMTDIGIYDILVTGGTSWGDSPGDFFDIVQDWANIEGLPKYGFYNG